MDLNIDLTEHYLMLSAYRIVGALEILRLITTSGVPFSSVINFCIVNLR